MISSFIKSPTTHSLVLATLALVAATAAFGSSAEARAGLQAADNAAPSTRSPATGGAGAASVTARVRKRGRCTLRADDSSPARE